MKDDDNRNEAAPNLQRRGAARVSTLGWVPYLSLCAIGIVLGLTSIEPSASDGLGTLNTMIFWAAHVVPALVLLAVVQMMIGQIERISALPGILQVLLSAVIASVVFAPVALGIDILFAGAIADDNPEAPILVRLALELAHFFIPLVLIWTLVNAPSLLQLERAGYAQPNVSEDADPSETLGDTSDEEAEFWSRIPGRLGRELVAMSAELHYLRVYTTAGDALILFPFGRAVEIFQDYNGMQVHRSHWIALDQVDTVDTRDRRMTCVMIGGPDIPVSRSYRSALKAALGRR